MPARNADRYLREAIDSILAQTLQNFEFIIIDDGSTDRTAEIIQHYAQADSRVRYVYQDSVGIAAALNVGLQHARGAFIARMDADDISKAERFAKQLAFLDQNADHLGVGSMITLIDDDGDVLGESPWPTTSTQMDELLMRGKGGIPHPTLFIRADAIRDIGGYREQYPFAEDKDLWLRLLERGKLANLDMPLLFRRLHPQAIGQQKLIDQHNSTLNAVRDAAQRRGVSFDPAVFDSPPPARSITDWHILCALTARQNHRYAAARKHALRSIAREPANLDTYRCLRDTFIDACKQAVRSRIASRSEPG